SRTLKVARPAGAAPYLPLGAVGTAPDRALGAIERGGVVVRMVVHRDAYGGRVDRVELSAEKYEQLFGSPPDPAAGPDPELMAILRHVIFGEVFQIGGADGRTRQRITRCILCT